MKKLIVLFSFFVLLTAGFVKEAKAQSVANSSEITIPWDEFKRLINLDEDEIVISLDVFQKLLEQTGVSTTPPHTIRSGNVVLKRDEFKNLINRMKPHGGTLTPPPFDFIITKAVYSGKMQKENTMFTGIFTLHVLKKDAYLKIPVLYQNIAISDIKVNGKPALVVGEGGYHKVIIADVGEYTVTADFAVKSSLDRGPHKFDFSIQQTPITLLRLEMPVKDVDVEIPYAQQVETKTAGSSTLVNAVMSQQNSVSVRWRKKIAAADKIPPKLYSEIYHLVSIDDDALKINSDINYNILHSEVDAVQIVIPDNMNALSVTGEGVGEWQEISKDNQRIILVPFTYGKKGNVTIRVNAETPLTENGLANLFSGFRTTETVRETGFIGVELNTSAEVIVAEIEGLEKISIQKLPQQLINKSRKPLILGFKYLKHPYNFVLDIKKHEKIGVPVAAINSASVVTLFTEDGKIVHRLVYQVRNSSKQFLQITLPENADVWSVFVDNQPVESSMNGEGELLVPLIRSRSTNNKLDTFPVEVIYNMVDDGFSIFGSQASQLPSVDLMVSQLIWSVYLPNDFSYKYFSSTLEKEEIIRGVNLFAIEGREYDEKAMDDFDMGTLSGEGVRDELKKLYKGKDYKSSFRNNALKEEQMNQQVASELEFSRRLDDLAEQAAPSTIYGGHSTGVLPIQIEVPTSGQVYRFAKSIIKQDDELSFNVIYTQSWVNDFVKWFFVFAILMLIYVIRQRIYKLWNWLMDKSKAINELYSKNEDSINKFIRSFPAAVILFILVIIFANISFLLTVILFSLFIVSIINLIVTYFKRRKTPIVDEKHESINFKDLNDEGDNS